ncbi:carbamoyltransferase HypF (plasmid) [Streptomyces sp. G6]|uniref:carbamoyltransferase HypF n=1 Tax=Streptomyces sp. G6 TaxID=1178736 RepID=UPI003ED8F1C7
MPTAPGLQRRRVTVRGAVQGVGFRPFVFVLAGELGLAGHVANTVDGVVAEVEGSGPALADFCDRVARDAPPLAVVESVSHEPVTAMGEAGFAIAASRPGSTARTLVAPDTATCDRCLAELGDPTDRRHRHPFISCTHCGPRFTIVTGLPYDRPQTTMAAFPMCPRCGDEYRDPADRRFHAQPIACHDCGPRLRLVTPATGTASDGDAAPLAEARRLLAGGAVVAVKGLGGYHLACDAGNSDSVRDLRRRKGRGDKPFALMVPHLADAERLAYVGAVARRLLTGGQRPIVLLRRRHGSEQVIAADVAPGSADLGVMLPYTPVHHLLFGLPGDPAGPRVLVMTSGNLAGEPIVTDDDEALRRLAGLADAWLTHDRPVHVPCDDSVVRVIDGHELPLRRSRGYAPLPVRLPLPVPPALAVGGDLKNTFCLGEGHRAWLSAHVGDMDDLATLAAFEGAERQLEEITGVRPTLLAADRHPRYRSRNWAERATAGRPMVAVQHHHAHIAAVLAENGHDGGAPVIGVAFDGTGYGDDGAVWGGEVLLADYDGYRRFAHLAYVPLPGGDAAVRRPYRMALSHLRAAGLPWTADLPCTAACPPPELGTLAVQLERGLHCVPTSSMGRLFDAVSSLIGVCHHARYEAQAAMELEAAAVRADGATGGYAFDLADGPGDALTADPGPVLAGAVADLRRGVPVELIAARFHRTVVDLVRRLCAAARKRHGLDTVALSGGVFANALLGTACADELRTDGFTVLSHRLVPPNDGGLALGQLMVASRASAATDSEQGPLPQPAHDRTHSEED